MACWTGRVTSELTPSPLGGEGRGEGSAGAGTLADRLSVLRVLLKRPSRHIAAAAAVLLAATGSFFGGQIIRANRPNKSIGEPGGVSPRTCVIRGTVRARSEV
jgi:hypothetical protein